MDVEKDYENFLERMDSVDWTIDEKMLMSEEEEFIKHHGVKGMQWGVRRYQPYSKGKRNAGKFIDAGKQKESSTSGETSILKSRISSKKRELSLAGVLKDINKLTTDEVQQVTTRARLENDLKRLSGTKNVGSESSQKEYRNRESMTNDKLKSIVTELQLRDNLRTEVKKANKDSIELGKKIAVIAAPLAVQVATSYMTGTNQMDKKWINRVLTKDPKNWDQIGSQAAKWVDNIV